MIFLIYLISQKIKKSQQGTSSQDEELIRNGVILSHLKDTENALKAYLDWSKRTLPKTQAVKQEIEEIWKRYRYLRNLNNQYEAHIATERVTKEIWIRWTENASIFLQFPKPDTKNVKQSDMDNAMIEIHRLHKEGLIPDEVYQDYLNAYQTGGSGKDTDPTKS
jgi:hypothetical protein